ncbi:hypothetical protein P3T22_006438 [Paraburkholderia sp. GAS348]
MSRSDPITLRRARIDPKAVCRHGCPNVRYTFSCSHSGVTVTRRFYARVH